MPASKKRQEARRARREEARARLSEIAAVADRVTVNTEDFGHITIAISELTVAEWWPGAAAWRWHGASRKIEGDFDALVRALKVAAAAAGRRPAYGHMLDDLIDAEDGS